MRKVSVAMMMLGLLVVISGIGTAMIEGPERAEGAGLLLGGLVALFGAGIEYQAGALVLRQQRRMDRQMQRQARAARKASNK